MRLTFFESRGFTVRWKSRADDGALRGLQNELLEVPERGKEIPGCGILRKYRFADPSRGKGKRGGLRVIYLYTPAVSRIDLLAVFGKDEKVDLSREEIKVLCNLARAIRQEAMATLRIGEMK
jgi:hypothetical protein